MVIADKRRDTFFDLVKADGLAQGHLQKCVGTAGKMAVRVNERRHQRMAFQIDHLTIPSRRRAHLCLASHGADHAVLHQKRLRIQDVLHCKHSPAVIHPLCQSEHILSFSHPTGAL